MSNSQINDINLKINSASYLGDFTIKLIFNDKTERIVDFKSFLKKSIHPSIKKYLEESEFKKFNIKDGNLNWNNYDIIFPIWDLYQGDL